MADLRRWDAIEAEAPDTFRHMCQFWVVDPAAPGSRPRQDAVK
jgi:hypothetical protein